ASKAIYDFRFTNRARCMKKQNTLENAPCYFPAAGATGFPGDFFPQQEPRGSQVTFSRSMSYGFPRGFPASYSYNHSPLNIYCNLRCTSGASRSLVSILAGSIWKITGSAPSDINRSRQSCNNTIVLRMRSPSAG